MYVNILVSPTHNRCVFFLSRIRVKTYVFMMRPGKNLSPVPVHIRYVRFLSRIRTKPTFLTYPGKNFYLGVTLGFGYRIYMYLCIPSLYLICQIFVCEDAKTAIFWYLPKNFFHKKKTGSSARPCSQKYFPTIYLYICIRPICLPDLIHATPFPCVCPFRVSTII